MHFNVAGCSEFELFLYKSHQGVCNLLYTVDFIDNVEHCMDICMDINDCRGKIIHTFYV